MDYTHKNGLLEIHCNNMYILKSRFGDNAINQKDSIFS